MADEKIPTFDELRKQREDHILGRGEGASKRPTVERQMDAAMAKLRGEEKEAKSEYELDQEYGTPEYFRNERDAFDKLSQRHREERQADEQAEADKQAAEATRKRQERQRSGNLSEDDVQVLTQIQAAEQEHQAAVDALQKAEAWLRENPDQDSATVQAKLVDERQRLEQEAAQIEQVKGAATQGVQRKIQQRGRAELPEELDDPEVRKELAEWLEGKGFSRTAIQRETDPSKIGVAFKQMRDEQAAERTREKAAKVAAYSEANFPRRGPLAPGGNPEPPRTSAEAREVLKKTGTVDDALHFIQMKRLESS